MHVPTPRCWLLTFLLLAIMSDAAATQTRSARPRARELGIAPGVFQPGSRNSITGQYLNGERFIPDQLARGEHRVPEAEGLLLTEIGNRCEVRDLPRPARVS